ncbi:hypothetical protein ABIB62_000417 [Mucilaginibacter sp. UYP25]|uniref:hypothetical protein n=1 Tax=unclassified Mucilaginibacter TaxID=2617802 RepID=UPI00339AF8A7
MSLDDLNGMIDRSLGVSSIMSNKNSFSKMLEASKGVSNILGTTNRMYELFGKSSGLSNALSGMDYLAKASTIQKGYLGIGSADWISQTSAIRNMGVPNNFFAISKGLGATLANSLSQNIGQLSASNLMIKGLGSTLGSVAGSVIANSLDSVLGKQYGILNQLTQTIPNGVTTARLSQYRNVFNTLGSLSAKIAAQGVSGGLNNESYNYFEDATEQAAEITNAVVQQQSVTSDNIDQLYILINDINKKVGSLNKSELQTISFWIGLLALFLSFYQIIQQKIDSSNPSSASATKQQLIDLRNEVIDAYKNNRDIYSPVRFTNRRCKLLVKPRLKSHLLLLIPINEKLSIINTKGKWVMVTCLDQDSLPVTGWILKKYLTKATIKAN